MHFNGGFSLLLSTLMSGAETTKGAASLTAAAFTVASFGVLVHFASQSFSAGMQSALRGILASLFIGIVILARKRIAKLARKQIIFVILVGFGGFGTLVLFTTAVNETKVATAAFFLFSTSIISSSIVGVLLFKEKTTLNVLAAIALACIGLLVYADGFSGSTPGFGILTGVGAGLCDSFSNTLRKSLKGTDRNTVLFYQYGISAIASVALILISKETAITHLSFGPIIAIILLSILTLIMGQFLLYGFSHFNINTGSVILSTQIFFAIVLAWLFFRNEPTIPEVVGCLLVVVASSITMIDFGKLFHLAKKDDLVKQTIE